MELVAFRLRVTTQLAVDDAWQRLWDLRSHSAVIPLTRVYPSGPLGPGSEFIARTTFGPFGFDDPMRVLHWEPPQSGRAGRAVIAKTGQVIEGGIDVTITPAGTSGARVVWRQRFGVRRLPAALRWPVAAVARLAYAIALRALLRRASATPLPR